VVYPRQPAVHPESIPAALHCLPTWRPAISSIFPTNLLGEVNADEIGKRYTLKV